MDLLQIFRKYFLGSLYLRSSIVHLYVCLSVKYLTGHLLLKLKDGFTSNFQKVLLRIPIFACSSIVRASVCQSFKILDQTSPHKQKVRQIMPCSCFKVFCTLFYHCIVHLFLFQSEYQNHMIKTSNGLNVKFKKTQNGQKWGALNEGKNPQSPPSGIF